MNVKNDKIRPINIVHFNKSRSSYRFSILLLLFFSNPIFQKNFLNFFELKFVDVQNLRDFDRFIYSFIVGNKRERRGGGREI